MPVLPLVASDQHITRFNLAAFSALDNHRKRRTVFTDPAGLLPSSFNHTSLPLSGAICCNFTRGDCLLFVLMYSRSRPYVVLPDASLRVLSDLQVTKPCH